MTVTELNGKKNRHFHRYLELITAKYISQYVHLVESASLLESITYALLLFLTQSLIVDCPPPLVILIAAFSCLLIPRLWAQNVVHVLDLVVLPYLVVHALCAHRLESIVDVWQRNPAPVE